MKWMLFIINLYMILAYILHNFYKRRKYNINLNYKFISYKSSKLEIEWLKLIKQYENNYTAEYCSIIKPFYKRLNLLQNDILKCKDNTLEKCKGDDLSYFVYKYKNGRIFKEYIEPLFGILRNTFAICSKNNEGDILSKDYLLPSYSNAVDKEIVYIDAGASTFHEGVGGSSQSYFYNYYKKYRSVKFRKWFLWEVKKQNITKIMNDIPFDIVNIYNYYNHPIVTDINSKNNPLTKIKQYQNNSYIIFKLDVDTPQVEIPIFDYLLNNNDIMPDEFYFEYHYFSYLMKKWWGERVDNNCSLYCATNKFLYLRKKGIRSHPWV